MRRPLVVAVASEHTLTRIERRDKNVSRTISKASCNTGPENARYKGSTIWNTLPKEIISITSTVSFVNKLHKILL